MATLKDRIIQGLIANAIRDWLANFRRDKSKMAFLSGYRTYIAAGVLLVLAGCSALGVDIPLVPDVNPAEAIPAAIGLIFAKRSAVNLVSALAVKNDLVKVAPGDPTKL